MAAYFPSSPFSTRFSGRENETKLRITNIVRGQRRRPAALVLILTLVIILSCGWMVSCRRGGYNLTLVMETQYYDDRGNYIEIPAAAMVGSSQAPAGLTELNRQLEELRAYYSPILTGELSDEAYETTCLLWPTQTGRYLNLLFLRQTLSTDANDNPTLTGLVYDKEEGVLLTMEDALALAGLTAQKLYDDLSAQYAPELALRPDAPLAIHDVQLQAFRMDSQGQPVFYLTARVDDVDDSVQDAVSGATSVYIRQGDAFTRWDCHGADPGPLVPGEECMTFDPPLYWQWQDSGQPQGGFVRTGWDSQTDTLMRLTVEDYDLLVPKDTSPVLHITQGDKTLLLARMSSVHTAGLDDLAVGVWDEGAQAFTGETFFLQGDEGRYIQWTEGEAQYLLCTNTGMWQGYEGCAGLWFFRFENGELTHITDLPAAALTGDVLDGNDPAVQQLLRDSGQAREAFWSDRKAIPVGNGFDLYSRNPHWDSITFRADQPQWLYAGHVALTEGAGDVPAAGEEVYLPYSAQTSILDYLHTAHPDVPQWFFRIVPTDCPADPHEGTLAIDRAIYEGALTHNGSPAHSFLLALSRYSLSDTDPDGTWVAHGDIHVILDGSMQSVLAADG